jgi:small subunit ribosomal protein S20
MPIKKSAIKAMRQANEAKARNKTVKADFRGKVKAVKKAAETGSKDLGKLTSEAVQAIDKAAKRGVIHKAAADRRKSRLVSFLKRTLDKPAAPVSIKEKTDKPVAKKPTTKKTTKKAS